MEMKKMEEEEQPSRPASPYLEDVIDPNASSTVKVLINNKNKIHRIRCRRNYNAIVTNIVSPSEIWIQIMNSISQQLVLSTLDAPILETNLIPGRYVLVPIDKEKLVRAQIIKVNDSKVLVRLIDSGSIVLRDEDAVFKMYAKKSSFHTFPWQSKPVMLFGVEPCNGKKWTPKETDVLKSVLSHFDYFYVKPIFSTVRDNNDDRHISRVSMIGMNGPLQQNMFDLNGCRIPPECAGMDIAGLYHMQNASRGKRIIFDTSEQHYFPCEFEDSYNATYQPFYITPNPNNTFEDEEKPFGSHFTVAGNEETNSFESAA